MSRNNRWQWHKQTRRQGLRPRRLRFEPLEDRRMLAVFSVDNLNDAGTGSLRDAITLANDSGAADEITFSVTGTVDLASQLPTITGDLTVTGPGQDLLTLDAGDGTDNIFNTGDGFRIFNIDDNSGTLIDVTLSGLTLTGGDVASMENGGGIATTESLSLINVIIHDNAAGNDAGAVFNDGGVLSLTSSRVTENLAGHSGGGIFTDAGELIVTSSTIADNSAGRNGGGIFSQASDTSIDSSTISGNTAATSGGGVFSFDNTINSTFDLETRIVNSTLSGNHADADGSNDAGGGIHIFSGLAVIRHSTITANSVGSGFATAGGISSGVFQTRTEVYSSIIAASTGKDVASGTLSSFQSDGYNIVGFGNAVGSFNQLGDQTGIADPLLTPLEDNGGPTLTHALAAGSSPAIDAGDPTAMAGAANVPDFDQRGTGFGRVVFGQMDVGAVEFQGTPPVPLVVDTTADELDLDYGPGDLSLREAIGLANFMPGPNTITFDSLLFASPRTISLTLGEMLITEDLTITGPGSQNLTIDANNSSRVFNIDDSDDGLHRAVELSGVRLTGGSVVGHGGAIFSRESLSLRDSVITANQATGGSNTGGGIYARLDGGATLTVMGSTIADNDAPAGGGIRLEGSGGGVATISDSTLSANSAVTGQGGGILNAGDLTIVNSTISGNSSQGAGSGVHNEEGPLSVRHGTIVDGVHRVSGTVSLDNSIVSTVSGEVTARYSLIGGFTGATLTDNGGNIFGLDPRLGPLADNGGLTYIHALLPGSPAVDAGDPNFASPPDFDQRGAPFGRVFDGNAIDGPRIDIGAYEAQQLLRPPLIVDTTDDENDGDYYAGNLSLREAVNLANAIVGHNTITFAANLSGQTIILGGAELELTETVTIDASALAGAVVIDGNLESRVFNVTAVAGDFWWAGLTITRGNGPSNEIGGGAVRSSTLDGLHFDRTNISASLSSEYGGGIFASGPVTLTGSTLTNNSRVGLHAVGDVTLVDSTVSGNTGGAFFSSSGVYSKGDVTLTDSFVTDNHGGILGGGITGQVVTLTRSIVSGNSVRLNSYDGLGGGIHGTTVTLVDSVVSGNTIAGRNTDGAGIKAESVYLIRSSVSDNHIGDSGYPRAAGISAGNVTLIDSTVSGNTGGGAGAGITGTTVELIRSTVSGNVAEGTFADGGGIRATTVTLMQSTVSGNMAIGSIYSRGGGIFGRDVTLTQSTVSNNVAGDAQYGVFVGGGVYSTGSLTIHESTIAFNQSPRGGGIASSGDSITIRDSIIAGNIAPISPDVLPRTSTLTVDYSLIGDTTDSGITSATGTGNLLDRNPQLGPLADNGGATLTHAPQPGSPVIDTGDPAFDSNAFDPPLNFDQRGAPYVRLFDGDNTGGVRIDMGAVEVQPEPQSLSLPGDYNLDNSVDAADYTIWRDTLGSTTDLRANGDNTGASMGVIDIADYAFWKANFGNTGAASLTIGAAISSGAVASAALGAVAEVPEATSNTPPASLFLSPVAIHAGPSRSTTELAEETPPIGSAGDDLFLLAFDDLPDNLAYEPNDRSLRDDSPDSDSALPTLELAFSDWE